MISEESFYENQNSQNNKKKEIGWNVSSIYNGKILELVCSYVCERHQVCAYLFSLCVCVRETEFVC